LRHRDLLVLGSFSLQADGEVRGVSIFLAVPFYTQNTTQPFVTGRGFPWFVFPLAGWGIGLVSHYFSITVHREADKVRSARVEREVEKIKSEQQ